jgi:hypothetical protein
LIQIIRMRPATGPMRHERRSITHGRHHDRPGEPGFADCFLHRSDLGGERRTEIAKENRRRKSMRFNLDVPVERRALKARDAIRLELEFPPSVEAREALRDWQARAASVLACLRPGRVPGPVKLTLMYEERAGRRDLDHLIRPVVELCVRHALIDSDHRATLREVRAGWGPVRGLRLTIEPATQDGGIYSL